MKTTVLRTSVIAVALLAAACGGSEQADTITAQPTTTVAPATTLADATDAAETTQPATEETTTEETTTTVADTTAEIEAASEVEDLERMSLQLADMPVGWSESVAEGDDDSSDAFCVEDDETLIDTESWPRVDKEFSAGAFGPFLSSSILAAPADDEAMDLIEQFAALAEQCPSWSDDEGTYTLSPVNYPSVGDETFVIRLTAESDGFVGIGDAIAIREGRIITLMVPLGIGAAVDADTVVGWMDLIDERD